MTEELAGMVEAVTEHNGSLEHLMFYELNEDFFQTFYNNPFSAVKAWAFGGDNNLLHEYVKFDGNGNLETFPEWKRNEILLEHKDEIAEEYENATGDSVVFTETGVLIKDKDGFLCHFAREEK